MVSTIHDTSVGNKEREDRKTNMEMNKPYAVVQYNKFIKRIDSADQYLSCNSVLNNLEWSK